MLTPRRGARRRCSWYRSGAAATTAAVVGPRLESIDGETVRLTKNSHCSPRGLAQAWKARPGLAEFGPATRWTAGCPHEHSGVSLWVALDAGEVRSDKCSNPPVFRRRFGAGASVLATLERAPRPRVAPPRAPLVPRVPRAAPRPRPAPGAGPPSLSSSSSSSSSSSRPRRAAPAPAPAPPRLPPRAPRAALPRAPRLPPRAAARKACCSSPWPWRYSRTELTTVSNSRRALMNTSLYSSTLVV